MAKLPEFLRVPRAAIKIFAGEVGRRTPIVSIAYSYLYYRDGYDRAVGPGELAWVLGCHRGTARTALASMREVGALDEAGRPALRFTRQEMDSFIRVSLADVRAAKSVADLDKCLLVPIMLGDTKAFRDPRPAPKGSESRLPIMSMLGAMIGRCAKTVSRKLRSAAGMFRPELAIKMVRIEDNRFRFLFSLGREAARKLGLTQEVAPAVPRIEIPKMKAPLVARVLQAPPKDRVRTANPRDPFADVMRPDAALGADMILAQLRRQTC